jgi:hypothetical protein
MNIRRKLIIALSAKALSARLRFCALRQAKHEIIKAMSMLIRLPWLLCATLSLTACAPMLSLVGINQTLVQVVGQVERVKLAGDGASYVASSKTITDHALSVALGKNCKVFNVVTPDPVCTDNTNVDTKVELSLGPEAESHPQPAAQATPESAEIATSAFENSE